MKNFNEIYSNIKKGNLDTILKDLQTKIDERSASKEEFKKMEMYTNIKNNVSKIDNILEFKAKLEKEKTNIDAEIAKIKSIPKLEDRINELNIQMQALQTEKQTIQETLSKKDLKDEERAELEARVGKIDLELAKNNNEFSINQKKMASAESSKEHSIEDISELENRKIEISSQISKCNMIVNNLIQGKSWDYVEMKLDNWKDRRFTSKEPISQKAEPIKGEAKVNEPETVKNSEVKDQGKEEKEEKVEDGAVFEDHDVEEIQLDTIFEDKHPRLAKVKEFFKKMAKKVKHSIINSMRKKEELEEIEVVEETKEDKNEEKINEESTVVESPIKENKDVEDKKEEKPNNDFKAYIREVAEKGLKQMEQEKNEKAKQDAKEKFKENKEIAYKRETEKFGKDYADRSYDGDER